MEGRTWPGGAGEEELPLGNQLEREPIYWGQEEGLRDRAVLGGGGWSTQHSWCLLFPGVLRTDPSGHAWCYRSFLRCDSGASLGCLLQDGAPGTVASSFASPRHLRSLENQTGVSPYPSLSPCHPQDRLRPVLLERWGHRRPPPTLEGSPLGSVGSAQARACGMGRHAQHVLGGSPEVGLGLGPTGRSETSRSRRRRRHTAGSKCTTLAACPQNSCQPCARVPEARAWGPHSPQLALCLSAPNAPRTGCLHFLLYLSDRFLVDSTEINNLRGRVSQGLLGLEYSSVGVSVWLAIRSLPLGCSAPLG